MSNLLASVGAHLSPAVTAHADVAQQTGGGSISLAMQDAGMQFAQVAADTGLSPAGSLAAWLLLLGAGTIGAFVGIPALTDGRARGQLASEQDNNQAWQALARQLPTPSGGTLHSLANRFYDTPAYAIRGHAFKNEHQGTNAAEHPASYFLRGTPVTFTGSPRDMETMLLDLAEAATGRPFDSLDELNDAFRPQQSSSGGAQYPSLPTANGRAEGMAMILDPQLQRADVTQHNMVFNLGGFHCLVRPETDQRGQPMLTLRLCRQDPVDRSTMMLKDKPKLGEAQGKSPKQAELIVDLEAASRPPPRPTGPAHVPGGPGAPGGYTPPHGDMTGPIRQPDPRAFGAPPTARRDEPWDEPGTGYAAPPPLRRDDDYPQHGSGGLPRYDEPATPPRGTPVWPGAGDSDTQAGLRRPLARGDGLPDDQWGPPAGYGQGPYAQPSAYAEEPPGYGYPPPRHDEEPRTGVFRPSGTGADTAAWTSAAGGPGGPGYTGRPDEPAAYPPRPAAPPPDATGVWLSGEPGVPPLVLGPEDTGAGGTRRPDDTRPDGRPGGADRRWTPPGDDGTPRT